MNTAIHHPFLNVPGQMGRFQLLEDGRQAYVSWARSQPDLNHYAGEICRKNGDVAVFLGTEENNDYFMHIMGSEVPDDATAIDLDEQEFIIEGDYVEDESWYSEGEGEVPQARTNRFDRYALAV
jgi:hypothetical protein